jgi:hypothetical protein
MLTVVVPAASASVFRRPSFFNDASHNAAAAETHGFLPNRSLLFLSKMSSADLTTAAGIDGGAELEERQDGKTLLRIKITAEVDGVRREYAITFGRYGEDNAAIGFAYASAEAPGGREADAERFSALVEALTGKRPRVYRMNNGRIKMEYGKEHLDGFARYAELADAIKKWLEETGR